MRRLFTRRQRDEIGDELRAHVAQRAAALLAEGVLQAEAHRQAREEFGVLEIYEAQCRREQRLGRVTRFAGGLTGDFVYAWRRLRATPLFTIFAVVSLATGVGVTTAIYSAVDSVFFKESGIPNASRVAVVVGSSVYAGGQYSWGGIVSQPDFDDIAASIKSLDKVAASFQFFQAMVTEDRSDTIIGEAVTGDFFPTVGVRAAHGRLLDPSDDREQRAVVVLSEPYWKKTFGADPRAIGRLVRIGGHPFEIVGVTEGPFEGLSLSLQRAGSVWIPLRSAALFPNLSSSSRQAPPREQRRLTVVGHLTEGRTAEEAAAEITTLSTQLDAAYPITARRWDAPSVRVSRNWNIRTIETAHADLSDAPRRLGLIIIILVAMVLVVACTNLANLTLARGAARRHEQGVRLALGASRWRLIRGLCVESTIVAVLGGVGSFLIIRVLLYFFTADVPLSRGYVMQLQPELNGGALLVAMGSMALCLAVFGLGPALSLTRDDVRNDLAQGAGAVVRGHTPSQRRSIRWQVAIAAGFFLISTMSVRTVVVLARHDSGIDLDRISVGFVSFSVQRWDEDRARRAADAIVRELREQPELESAALSSGMPFGTTSTPFLEMTTPGNVFVKGGKYPDALALVSTPEIFRTLGVPILRGRGFDERDAAGARRVVVMNELAARDMFRTTDVVGRDVAIRMWAGRSLNPEPFVATVIGVAGDTDAQFLGNRNSGTIFIPFAQQYEPDIAVVGRARSDTRKATDALRAAVRAADPEVSITTAGPGSTILGGSYYLARLAATTSTLLGLLALVLSMVGLHGVLAQMVTMRTREVGLRIALGAERRQISRMVLVDGFRPVLQGLAIGLLLGVAGRLVLRATVSPAVGVFDPLPLIVIPIPVVIAGFLACYLPARRAAEVDPNVALRAL